MENKIGVESEETIYTKKKLIKDVKEIIDYIWKYDPPTENPYNWQIIEILADHRRELQKAKNDEEALEIAKKFKEKYGATLRDVLNHIALVRCYSFRF